ncbi:MAG: Tim44 domain-containing protein [Novosphingobium sp.]|nr:Tim44 domain-containing protein [Novosphingobium sp.]MBO9603498.1 Tim44 domain-containing protein [Novosphingobium sp.]
MIYEIVILAMIAAFLGLRLYSVLGRRAEHEEEPVPTRFEQPESSAAPARPSVQPASQPLQPPFRQREMGLYPPALEQGLRAIGTADRAFDVMSFMEGAKSAYGVILDAFWRGDKAHLAELCDRDVYDHFTAAIDERVQAGETLDNRLVRIEQTELVDASLDGKIARITVRFTADIASVTRDKDGHVVAGSLNDAVESRDVWTFMRDVTSAGPDWLLDETDEG